MKVSFWLHVFACRQIFRHFPGELIFGRLQMDLVCNLLNVFGFERVFGRFWWKFFANRRWGCVLSSVSTWKEMQAKFRWKMIIEFWAAQLRAARNVEIFSGSV